MEEKAIFRLSGWPEGDTRELFIVSESAEEAAKLVSGVLEDEGEDETNKNVCCWFGRYHVILPKSLFTSPKGLPREARRFGKHWWYDITTSTGKIVTIFYIFRDSDKELRLCLEKIPHLRGSAQKTTNNSAANT